MKLGTLICSLLAAAIFIAGCATPFKPVKNLNTPFERRDYSILPPQEHGWKYMDQAGSTGSYGLIFAKADESKIHTVAAMVREWQKNATFSSPEEFLSFVKKSDEMGTDPRISRMLEKKMSLDDRFVSYCIFSYFKVEDHAALQKGKLEFLLMFADGYTFIHPNNKNIIIEVTYSERGAPNEIGDSKFIEKAQNFVNGLKLK